MDVISSSLWLLLTWVLVIALHSNSKARRATYRNLPPGPTQFPVVGNLLELGDKPHKSLAKLAKIHGPLMCLKLGQVTAVVISSASMAKEVLQIQDASFCNRAVPDALTACEHHRFSVIFLSPSPAWRNLKKLCNSNIFSSQKLDANQYLRHKKVQDLLAYVQESCVAGRAINIGQAAFSTTVNLLSNTIFSVDLADPSSDTTREFKERVWAMMVEAGRPNLADYFPVLKKIDPQGIRRRMTNHLENMLELFDGMIGQRLKLREVYGSGKNKDVLDTLLNIISEENSEGIDRNYLKHLFVDLFVAGTDTTSSTLEWAMAELIHKPEALRKAQSELRQTLGRGNIVQESDIDRLPYLRAVVKETFRLHPAAPMLPHRSSTDVELGGFVVPKGAQVLVNAWAIGRDETMWEDPNSFTPERFLASDLDVKGSNFGLIPFGAGRRICPGLPLAVRMLHLMLGSLVHSFNWTLGDGIKPENMDMDDEFGIALRKAQPLLAIPIANI